MVKNYFKSYLYLFGLIVVFTLLISIFNYVFSRNFTIIKISIPIISMFVSSMILGKCVKQKAYLEGVKFSGFFVILAILLNLFFKGDFDYKTIILYITLMVIGVIGAMLGINLKKSIN